jgi:hypothetical protein
VIKQKNSNNKTNKQKTPKKSMGRDEETNKQGKTLGSGSIEFQS